MASENLGSTTVLEKPVQPETIEFNGKHLEAAFAIRAGYHKQRILGKFDDADELPPLPRGELDITISESEKRFQKAYDLLRREEPVPIPLFEGELSRDYIIAVADNLAWKGIESCITTAHLNEIDKALLQLSANGKSEHNETAELRSRERDLKTRVLEGSHFYRDFFDSEAAKRLRVDSPTEMKKFFKKTSLTGNGEDSTARLARGIALEIAASRYLADLLNSEDKEVTVGFGSSEEDHNGGDIVVVRSPKILFIDLKNSPPNGLGSDEIEAGFRLYTDAEKGIYKAIVWPESQDAVAEDSFRLTDPLMQSALREIIATMR